MTWRPPSPWDRALNRERLLAALYCCGPTGLGQLAQHLHARGFDFSGNDLSRELGSLVSEQKVVQRAISLSPGVEGVVLYAPLGHGL